MPLKFKVAFLVLIAMSCIHLIYVLNIIQALAVLFVPGYTVDFYLVGAFFVARFMLSYLEDLAYKYEKTFISILSE